MKNIKMKLKLLITLISIVLFSIIIHYTNTIIHSKLNVKHKKTSSSSSLHQVSAKSISPDKNVANVKDYGAYGDGIHDDTKAITAALNSGAKYVIFEKNAEYKTTDYIMMRKGNVTVLGNNATLFTDNSYRKRSNFYEWYFNIASNDVVIDGLNILAKETILVGYKTQLSIRNATNVYVRNCNFTIPDTVLKDAGTRDVEYSNVDLYGGWHNIKIENCELTQLADTNAGVNIEFRDLMSTGCDNAVFSHNRCITNSHDEILALFSSKSSSISNITISDNSFTAKAGITSKVRNVGISLGYSSNNFDGINGVIFTENELDIQSDYILFLLGNSKKVTIHKNRITYSAAPSTNTAYVVRGASTDNSILFSDNDIKIKDNTPGNFGGLATGVVKFHDNTVIIDAPITFSLFATNSYATSNNITINNKTAKIGYNVSEFTSNKIYLKGSADALVEFNNKMLTQNNIVRDNIIYYYKPITFKNVITQIYGINNNGFTIINNNNKLIAATDDLPNPSTPGN